MPKTVRETRVSQNVQLTKVTKRQISPSELLTQKRLSNKEHKASMKSISKTEKMCIDTGAKHGVKLLNQDGRWFTMNMSDSIQIDSHLRKTPWVLCSDSKRHKDGIRFSVTRARMDSQGRLQVQGDVAGTQVKKSDLVGFRVTIEHPACSVCHPIRLE